MQTMRLKHIDRLKGMAMLSVVTGHMAYFVLKLPHSVIHDIVSVYQMPLFFFLSGIVINNVTPRKSLSQCFRFMIPFLIFGGLYTYSKGQVFADFIGDSMKSGFWFLYVLAVFYLILLLFRFKKPIYNVLLFMGLYVVANGMCILLPKESVGILSLDVIGRFLLYFYAGFFLKKYYAIEWIRNKYCFTISSILFIAGTVVYVCGYVHAFRLAAFCGVLCFYNLFANMDTIENKMLAFLEHIGKNSLDVYLLHYFFFIIYNSVVGGGNYRGNNEFIIALICVGNAVVLSYMCTIIGKILHRIDWCDKILYGNIAKSILR